MNLVILALTALGVPVTPPWELAAEVFLVPQLVNTPAGLLIGLVGTVALSIASALVVYLVLRWTGYDYAVFKGIIATNAFSFVTMGLFMPLLNIAPQIRRQPVTLLTALAVLTLIGAVMSVLLKRMHRLYS